MIIYDRNHFQAKLTQYKLKLLRINDIKFPRLAISELENLRADINQAIEYLKSWERVRDRKSD